MNSHKSTIQRRKICRQRLLKRRRLHPYTICTALLFMPQVAGAASFTPSWQQDLHQPVQQGMASWYGGTFFQGKRTAHGQRFNHNALTAAHRSLPFGTKVLVHSPRTRRSVIVTVNDRGPFARNRIIDLSRQAATQLGIVDKGVAPVSITILKETRKGAASAPPP